jgi:hypothetical protein
LLITVANIVQVNKPDDLEELFADAAQRFEPYPEPAGPATHLETVVSDLTKGLEPAKHHSTRNTPEKKAMRKDWCLRLSAIRTECDISVQALTDHREGKAKQRNWENIERAAGLEVHNNNNKQDFPRYGTIAAYVKRLHLIVITAAHKAAMAASPVSSIRFDNFDERFYNSRADLLLEIYREIETANPNVRVNNSI